MKMNDAGVKFGAAMRGFAPASFVAIKWMYAGKIPGV